VSASDQNYLKSGAVAACINVGMIRIMSVTDPKKETKITGVKVSDQKRTVNEGDDQVS